MVAIRWRKWDREAADAWLEKSDLPELNRERVRLYGQRGKPKEIREEIKAMGRPELVIEDPPKTDDLEE